MKGLLIALQFMTRLPGPRLNVSAEVFAASMNWFPAVGLVVGLFIAGAAWAGAFVDPWVSALAGLIVWIAVTGALHLDGLGDVADALGAAHKDRERMVAVLADPHVGSFAVVAIGSQLIAKLVLLHHLAEAGDFVPLIFIPMAARMGPLLWARTLTPLHDGLGARFRDAVGPSHLAIWALVLLVSAWFHPALIGIVPLIIFIIFWIRASLGGISGDSYGAGIEIVETGLLLAFSIFGE